MLLLFIVCFGSVGHNFGFTDLRSYSSNSEIYDVFKQDDFHLLMFKEFRCPENTEKVPGVHYFSPDRPKITKRLMVVMKNNTIRGKMKIGIYCCLTADIKFFFSEMFLEQSSTIHMNFVQIAESDWLSWQHKG